MATNVLHHLQRLTGMDIHELPDRLGGYHIPVFIYQVTGMDQEFGLGELQLA